MSRGHRILLGAFALLAALPSRTGAQCEPVPAFSGRYRFTFTVSPSCPPQTQVGPLSVVMNLAEASVSGGSEVSGAPASSSQTPNNGRFVLLRLATHLHGPSASAGPELGLDTEGKYRIWMRVMADGTAAVAADGRARASGSAFGEIELSLASDPSGNPIDGGYCQFASGHQWSLEPA